MTLRHTLVSALTVVATASSVLVAAPASAAAPEDLQCRSAVGGTLPNNKFVTRYLENGAESDEKLSAKRLPFRPTNLAFGGHEEIRGGHRTWYVATAADGRPRLVAVDNKRRLSTLSTSVYRTHTTGFTPRLFALNGVGRKAFGLALEGSTLRRYTLRATQDGKTVLDSPRTALRRMGKLKTLSWYYRARVAGVQQDVFFATTKGGALLQVRVPVKNPAKAKAITVKRGGFGAFTGLSLSWCNDGAAAYITGINANADNAKWFTLRRPYQPKAANLTAHGQSAEGANWRIRPTV